MGLFDDLDDLDFHKKSSGAKKVRPQNENSAPVEREKFPCQSCAGTGRYRAPRVHQEKSHCFACAGRGFFYTSAADRYKKREDAKKRKQAKVDQARSGFLQAYPNFLPLLREACNFSEFAREMWTQLEAKGAISDAQVATIERMMAKANATREAKRAEADANKIQAVVDLSPIHAIFDHARQAGLKKLKYRAEGLVINPASATSANAGALYVKTEDGMYLGKVVGEKFIGSRDAKEEHKNTLAKIAVDPVEVAKTYGKLTGRCSCCGRTLSDPVSIELGIGPVCIENWFGDTTPGPTRESVKAHLKEAEVKINTNYGKAKKERLEPTEVKASATKYDYPAGLTDAQKKAYRAKMRKERNRV